MNKLTASREDVTLALNALRTLEDLDTVFAGLIPSSYMRYVKSLRNSLMKRDLIDDEFKAVSELHTPKEHDFADGQEYASFNRIKDAL